ncbi:MAG TPA: hypothetical protein VGN16_19790 [Acidobacteriaceae bacterium]
MHLATAQNNAPPAAELPCFRISIDLDDSPVPDALNVYITQNGRLNKLAQVDGCFRLPAGFKKSEKVNVRIDLEQDSLSLPGVPAEYLGRSWSIALSDKMDVITMGRMHYKASQVCQVVVHGGEPEIGFTSAPCRSPRRPPHRH